MTTLFKPSLSRKQLQKEFDKLQKLNYNAYRWWRMYESKNKPLCKYKSLRERIANGDFEFSHYYLQALWVEHDINDLEIQYKDDPAVFVEKSSVLRARRKRLYEDYERDESEKMNELKKSLLANFQISKEQLEKVMEEFGGTTLELYFHLDDNYKIIPSEFDNVAIELSDRSLDGPKAAGIARGDETNKDWYSFAGITLSFRINGNSKGCDY